MPSDIPRHVLPVPDRPYAGPTMYDAGIRMPSTSRSSRCARRPAPPTSCSSCWTMPALARTARSAVRAGRRPSNGSPPEACAISGSTRPRCARPHARRCSPDATITRWEWAPWRTWPSAAPGYTSRRPNTAATTAEMLRLNGYSTAQFGKCHEVPSWEWSPMGPFDRWPTGSGFEYFYGFIGGETSQFYPSLIEGTTPVTPDRTPEEGYHLTEDLAEKARRWLGPAARAGA